MALSPDGRRMACGTAFGTITLWDQDSGAIAHTLERPRTSDWSWNPVTAVTFFPDGKRLASGSVDRSIKLWDSESGALLSTITGYAHMITGIAFSPDGRQDSRC